VSFLLFERETGVPLVRIEAERARLEPGLWHLEQAKRWDLAAGNPERDAQTFATLEMPSDLTGARIRESFARAGVVSVWRLPDFIRALDRAGLSSRVHRSQFQAELALPVLMAAMMLVGAVLNFKHARAGNAGTRILMTVLAGFALFFLRNFAQVLGENGQIPLALAIWTPPIASMLLALGVLLHLEDG
jgi:lipopolysaccharide export system permease protein